MQKLSKFLVSAIISTKFIESGLKVKNSHTNAQTHQLY